MNSQKKNRLDQVGGLRKVNPMDHDLNRAFTFVRQDILGQLAEKCQQFKLGRITNASVQLVAGKLYRAHFSIIVQLGLKRKRSCRNQMCEAMILVPAGRKNSAKLNDLHCTINNNNYPNNIKYINL
ncbi:hypothetical protein BLOT_008621 [Blomia tropicalis]|nr:hypothetical protein BLOT_008621 [Blomia tropicalis]